MTENKNFSNQALPSIVDAEYYHCNFTQNNCIDDGGDKKGVRLFPGDDTPRTFVKCNMTNCEPPPGSTLIKSFPTIVERNVPVSSEDIVIDGIVVTTVVDYVDRIHGSYDGSNYIYHSTPIDIPREAE